MNRFAYPLLLGLVGAGIVHIVVLLLIPSFVEDDAWARLAARGGMLETVRLQENAGSAVIPGGDPFFLAAACRFDTGEGVAHVTADRYGGFWSVSVYDRYGRNLFSFNDRTASSGIPNVTLVTPAQLIELRKDIPAALEQSVFVEVEEPEGIVVLRGFFADETFRAQAERFLASMRCALI